VSAELWTLLLLLVASGAFAGFFAGLLGIGGGTIMVPAMFYSLHSLGYGEALPIMKFAVVTSMVTILPTGLSSALTHYKNGNVDWDLFKQFLPGIIIGVFLGGYLILWLDAQMIQYIFIILIIGVAIQMLYSAKAKDDKEAIIYPHAIIHHSWVVMIGMLSTILGVGGGALNVPTMNHYGAHIKIAIGTAATIGVVIAFIALMSQIYYGLGIDYDLPYSFGYISLLGVFALSLGAVALAPIGAKVANRINKALLKRIFAIFLILNAINMFFS
jgi:uncharacterized membrane protein YfcA